MQTRKECDCADDSLLDELRIFPASVWSLLSELLPGLPETILASGHEKELAHL